MTSLWLDTPAEGSGSEGRRMAEFIPGQFVPGHHYDVVVAGAGLTGLVTALLLARGGAEVLVLEARYPGAAATGNTTAKLSLLQGTTLSSLRAMYPQRQVNAYVEANRAGQGWLLDYLESRGVPFQYRDAYTFATTTAGARRLRAEERISLAAGLQIEASRETGLPFAVEHALRLGRQAQFNPMDVLTALSADVAAAGGRVVEGVRLLDVRNGSPLAAVTRYGEVKAGSVVLATGTPVLDRGLYFAKLRPHRSYAAALRLPDGIAPPPGMYLSAEPPTRSLRDHPAPDGDLLLVGGFGHPGGRAQSPQAHLGQLLSWAQEHYPGAGVTHTWSAQDYRATNLMPFFGRLPRGHGMIFFGTGYNKWGMSNGVAAALDISADILHDAHQSWARTIHHRVTSPAGAASAVQHNVDVAVQTVRDKTGLKKSAAITEDTQPAEGTGVTGLFRGKPSAVSTVNGVVCRVSAQCTHLGGTVHWNDAEKSWDCPLHGSRFAAGGSLLEGPATRDLPEL